MRLDMAYNSNDSAAILAEIMKRTVGNSKIQAKQRVMLGKLRATPSVGAALTDVMNKKIREYDAKQARH